MGITDLFDTADTKEEQALAHKKSPLDTAVEELCRYYTFFIEGLKRGPFNLNHKMSCMQEIIAAEQQLPPVELDEKILTAFSKQLSTFIDHDSYHETAGRFLSALMIRAYKNDHNDFTLFMPPTRENCEIGACLAGSPDNPIKLTINGPTAYETLQECINVYVIHNGDMFVEPSVDILGNYGLGSVHSHFLMNGHNEEIYTNLGPCNLYFTDPDQAHKTVDPEMYKDMCIYTISHEVDMSTFSKIIDALAISKQEWKWKNSLNYQGIQLQKVH